MPKKNGRTPKRREDPMHLQQAVMEAMLQTFQRGAMRPRVELAQHALRTNPRLKRLLNQYAEAAVV